MYFLTNISKKKSRNFFTTQLFWKYSMRFRMTAWLPVSRPLHSCNIQNWVGYYTSSSSTFWKLTAVSQRLFMKLQTFLIFFQIVCNRNISLSDIPLVSPLRGSMKDGERKPRSIMFPFNYKRIRLLRKLLLWLISTQCTKTHPHRLCAATHTHLCAHMHTHM